MAQKLDMPKEVEDQLNYWDDRNRKLKVSQNSAVNILLLLLPVLLTVARCYASD